MDGPKQIGVVEDTGLRPGNLPGTFRTFFSGDRLADACGGEQRSASGVPDINVIVGRGVASAPEHVLLVYVPTLTMSPDKPEKE